MEEFLISRMMLLIPLLLSLTVHEWAHAWSAWLLGDDTAKLQGRLTLNPLAHIDPVGTLLLPLLGVPFGWAKPVPLNPLRFRRTVSMRMGILLTAAAGPLANVCLGTVSIVTLALMIRFRPELTMDDPIASLIWRMVFLNVILATFNMLPIPPLDGSRVVDSLMPNSLRPLWEAFARLGPIALIAVIMLPFLSGISLFEWPLRATSHLLRQLVILFGG